MKNKKTHADLRMKLPWTLTRKTLVFSKRVGDGNGREIPFPYDQMNEQSSDEMGPINQMESWMFWVRFD